MRRLLVVLMLVSTSLLFADPAGAHAEVRESDPARDGEAPTGTDEITMTFIAFDPTVPVDVEVRGADGTDHVAGEASISAIDSVVTVPLEPLDNGEYRVHWHAMSNDGDGLSEGDFAFTVEDPPGTGPGIWLIWGVAIAIPAFVFLRPGGRTKKA